MSAVNSLSIALIQAQTHWHEPQRNQDMFESLFEQVPDHADLVVLPEMFSTGFTMASEAMAQTMDGATVAWLCDQAGKLDKVVCGSVVISDGGKFHNRLVWATPDGGVEYYDKRHCFRMADEHKFYSPGDRRVVVTLSGWRILLSVCYDLRFPVWLRNRGDYDVLLCVANWPAARRDAWMALLKARAIENQAYAAGVNIVGTDGNGVAYSGGSAVYTPEGQALGEFLDDPVVAEVNLDDEALQQLRQKFPVWQDADSFELTQTNSEV